MKWIAKRWPYEGCYRIVTRFHVLPKRIGCTMHWLTTNKLKQVRSEGKWVDVGWVSGPIGEMTWTQVSRNEWRSFTPWEVIEYKRYLRTIYDRLVGEAVKGSKHSQHVLENLINVESLEQTIKFGKWLKSYHNGK